MTRPPPTSRDRALRDSVARAILAAFAAPASAGALDALAAAHPEPEVAGRVHAARQALAARSPALPGVLGVAAALWDAGLFFEVHEILEEEWQGLAGERRRFYQGLIQVAVALHHVVHGNPRSAVRLLGAARAKLVPSGPAYEGVDVARLVAGTEAWERHLTGGDQWPEALPVPPLVPAP